MEEKYYIWNKKKKISENFKLTLLAVSWMLVGIVISLLVVQLNLHFPEFSQSKLIDNNCNKTDIFTNAECLNNKLGQWWYYNISNIGKELSLEELKEKGGVCSHATEWFLNNINNSIFYTERVLIKINKSKYHTFAIMSNEQGYCLLDQKIIQCFGFEDEKDE